MNDQRLKSDLVLAQAQAMDLRRQLDELRPLARSMYTKLVVLSMRLCRQPSLRRMVAPVKYTDEEHCRVTDLLLRIGPLLR